MNSRLSIFFKNFFRRETTTRAIKVALVVAPILIIINHHDTILESQYTPLLFIKCSLTFLVPYCVSAFSSARAYSSQG
ncbi:nitrate/nitrite transporter NrtS [Desulfobacterota bacterium AH_259_B03_O07]|nr:nitrate/nitrite transporter NrtS [Desulfobacterota bacterium AH_259_B03_O07]